MLSMPLLILIAAVCPSGAMSTTYALVTSVQVRPICSEPPRPSALFHDHLLFPDPFLFPNHLLFPDPFLFPNHLLFHDIFSSTSFHELPRASTSFHLLI